MYVSIGAAVVVEEAFSVMVLQLQICIASAETVCSSCVNATATQCAGL